MCIVVNVAAADAHDLELNADVPRPKLLFDNMIAKRELSFFLKNECFHRRSSYPRITMIAPKISDRAVATPSGRSASTKRIQNKCRATNRRTAMKTRSKAFV